ncbi:MAG: glycosyltransferase family 2 protein [Bacillota bacterium]
MVSLIVPIYNEEEVFHLCYAKIKETMEKCGEKYEIIFINDGSKDKSLELLKECQSVDETVKVLSFSRNFGHQNAVSCGMEHAVGDCAVIIDADLQDPPEVIYEMIAKWKEGYEIVYGKRLKRHGETAFKKVTAKVYYKIVDSLADVKIPRDAGDFRLIDRKVINTIVDMKEHNRYLRGMNGWAGYKTTAVEFVRMERAAGETKYTMKKMLKLASDGIISNSNKPLFLAMKFGIFFLILSGLGMIALIVLEILAVVGTIGNAPSLVFWICDMTILSASVVLIFQGIQNMYIARLYDEAKNRPNYIVSEKYGFGK